MFNVIMNLAEQSLNNQSLGDRLSGHMQQLITVAAITNWLHNPVLAYNMIGKLRASNIIMTC